MVSCTGLPCCAQAFSSFGVQASHRIGFSRCRAQALGLELRSCDARAELLCRTWDLPRPGVEPMLPALAGRFLKTGPPEKSPYPVKLLAPYLSPLDLTVLPYIQ